MNLKTIVILKKYYESSISTLNHRQIKNNLLNEFDKSHNHNEGASNCSSSCADDKRCKESLLEKYKHVYEIIVQLSLNYISVVSKAHCNRCLCLLSW